MNTIFANLVTTGKVAIYLDNILIYSTCQVLNKLEENDLYFKPKKCAFKQDEINHLGVIVGCNTIKMDPSKIKRVAD